MYLLQKHRMFGTKVLWQSENAAILITSNPVRNYGQLRAQFYIRTQDWHVRHSILNAHWSNFSWIFLWRLNIAKSGSRSNFLKLLCLVSWHDLWIPAADLTFTYTKKINDHDQAFFLLRITTLCHREQKHEDALSQVIRGHVTGPST